MGRDKSFENFLIPTRVYKSRSRSRPFNLSVQGDSLLGPGSRSELSIG
jgi:hypothetical protein